jgi:hypothetical protein
MLPMWKGKQISHRTESPDLGPWKKIIIHIAPDFGSPAGLKKVRILVVCKSFFNTAGGPKDKQDG